MDEWDNRGIDLLTWSGVTESVKSIPRKCINHSFACLLADVKKLVRWFPQAWASIFVTASSVSVASRGGRHQWCVHAVWHFLQKIYGFLKRRMVFEHGWYCLKCCTIYGTVDIEDCIRHRPQFGGIDWIRFRSGPAIYGDVCLSQAPQEQIAFIKTNWVYQFNVRRCKIHTLHKCASFETAVSMFWEGFLLKSLHCHDSKHIHSCFVVADGALTVTVFNVWTVRRHHKVRIKRDCIMEAWAEYRERSGHAWWSQNSNVVFYLQAQSAET